MIEDQFQNLYELGNYSELLDLAEQNLDTTMGKYWQLTALWRLSRLDYALDLAKAYENQLENDDDKWKIRLLLRTGVIHFEKGELDTALDYFQRGMKIQEEDANPQYIASFLNNIGGIYNIKGDLDKALDYFHRSLKLVEEIGNSFTIATILHNIGSILLEKRELNTALDYFQRSLKLRKELGNPQSIVSTTLSLIETYIHGNEREMAKLHVNQLEEIRNEHPDDRRIQLYTDLSTAIYLKSSKRNRDKVKAQIILEQMVESNDFLQSILLVSLKYLVELLLIEYKSYNEPEVRDEIENYIGMMYEAAQDHHLYSTMVDVLILWSRLSIVKNDFDHAQTLLTQAMLTAEEKNMPNYIENVRKEQIKFNNELHELKDIFTQSSVASRIEKSRILDYINKVKDLQ